MSPIHVVPKNASMNIVKNEKGGMVPMRIQKEWQMCIDFRKLNEVMKKDHFSIPFLDQMVERLPKKPLFCLLVGFSRFYQIPIA